MPISETTYDDRLGRGRLMQQAIIGFAPPFTPSDPDIDPPTFQTFLDSIEAQNLAVKNARSSYTVGATLRLAIVKDLKTRSQMTRNYVDSVSGWKQYRATVRNITKKILGYRPPKPKLPPGTPAPKKRNVGEQSFAELAGFFNNLISTVTGITGYGPTNLDLTVPQMIILFTSFNAKNAEMDTLASNVSIYAGVRFNLYEGDTGLRVRMLAIKDAVRAQYGITSPEYLSVKGIKV